MQRHELDGLSREELIAVAEGLGVPRPRVLTQPELIDEIIGRTAKNEREKARSRGLLGRARDLLARVVERGLHLPEAARALRGTPVTRTWPTPPPPLPTVTLAEIYAAQGHLERAITVLDEVLAREPDHQEAVALRERFMEQQAQKTRARAATASTDGDGTPAKASAPVGESPQVAAVSFAENADASGVSADASGVGADASRVGADASGVGADASEVRAAAAKVGADASGVRADASEAGADVTKATADATEGAAIAIEASADATKAAADASRATADATGATANAIKAAADDAGAVAEASDEAPPLPERYDVDEIVAIAVDPQTLYVYWEIRPTTFARAETKRPKGKLSIRVIAVTPSWDGPVTKSWDVPIDALYGDQFIRDIPPGANVRVSVGWLDAASFEPFAVGLEVASPRALPAEPTSVAVGRWTADPAQTAREIRHAEHGGQPGEAFSRMGSDVARIPWRQSGLPIRSFEGAAVAAGRSESAQAGAVDDTFAWVDPAARRAASPSFMVRGGGGGASELSRR